MAPTLLALVLVAGLVVLGIAGTDATRAAPAPNRAGTTARAWSLRLAPAPNDFALAEIRFPGIRHRAITRDQLNIEMQAPFGSDYLVLATLRATHSGVAQAFVLLVNRPSALEDPTSVRLRLSTRGRLAEHNVRRVGNPFAEPSAAAASDLCDLAPRRRTLQASDLRPLRSEGTALDGFGAAAAVAQAYDVTCGLPYESAFKQVITGTSTQPQPAPPQPTPAPPQPQPAPPAPPVGKLPGEGCVPAPGYACPEALQSSSPAAALASDRRAATGAH